MPRLCLKQIGAHLPRIERRNGVADTGKRLMQRSESVGAHAAVAAFAKLCKFAVSQLDGLAVFIGHRSLVEIGAFQHGKSRVHARQCGRCQREELLLAL